LAKKRSKRPSSLEEAVRGITGQPKNKFNAVKKVVDDIEFDSTKEGNRYKQLKLLVRAGKIRDLRLQVRYDLIPKQKFSDGSSMIGTYYLADFVYFDCDKGREVVEDVKGKKTDVYQIKRKLMKLILDIEIFET
jgi:hypothetical protein